MATQSEVAAHLDLTQPAVSQMLAEGLLPTAARRGQLDLDACRIAYIRRLREQAAGRASLEDGDDKPDLVRERALLARAQREGQNMKNAVLRGELLPVDEVEDVVGALLDATRAKMLALPTRAAPQCVGVGKPETVRDLLTGMVHDALSELSHTVAIVGAVIDRARRGVGGGSLGRQLGEESEAAAAPDGEPMGGPVPVSKRRGVGGAGAVEHGPG